MARTNTDKRFDGFYTVRLGHLFYAGLKFHQNTETLVENVQTQKYVKGFQSWYATRRLQSAKKEKTHVISERVHPHWVADESKAKRFRRLTQAQAVVDVFKRDNAGFSVIPRIEFKERNAR